LGYLEAGGFIIRVARRRKGVNEVKGKLEQNLGIFSQPSLEVSIVLIGGCFVEKLVKHRLVLEHHKFFQICVHKFAVTAGHQTLDFTIQ